MKGTSGIREGGKEGYFQTAPDNVQITTVIITVT